MTLDLHTLFWVLSLTFGMTVLFSLVLYRIEGPFPGARLWIIAQALAALGTLLFSERDAIPYLALVAANALLVTAELAFAHAAWAYRRDRRFPVWTYALVLIVVAVLIASDRLSFNFRNIVVSAAMGSVSSWTSAILYRGIDKRYRSAAFFAALPFALGAAGDFAQVILSLGAPRTMNYQDIGVGHAFIYLLSIAMASFFLLGFFLLATQRRRYLTERQGARLAEANAALQEADRVKDLFLSMLAHDLRSPISGAARYARKHLLPPEVDLDAKRRALGILVGSLEKAANLLENLLLWSKSRKDEFPLFIEEFDLAEETRAIVGLFLPAFEEKGIGLSESLAPSRLRSERESVDLIIRNMVSNALKFSQPGAEVEIATKRDASGFFEVTVGDRGAGIDPDIRSRLYRIDVRVTSLGTAGEGGSGLGLILCADYARRIGATFGVEEREGGGTLARIRLTSL
jgi:signal transduction histidine kinase